MEDNKKQSNSNTPIVIAILLLGLLGFISFIANGGVHANYDSNKAKYYKAFPNGNYEEDMKIQNERYKLQQKQQQLEEDRAKYSK